MLILNLNLFIAAFSVLLYYFTHIKLIYAQNEGDLLWGYSPEDGPQLWCTVLHEGQCCSHLSQSPINIDTAGVKFMSDELHLFNYNITAHRIVLANNGRTAVVHMFDGRKTPYLRLGSRKIKFGLNSFHFHWGSHDNNGSEHSINDHRYPLEMHLVHVNQKYETLEVARQYPDGIAVIAIFLQISEIPNKQYDKLIKALTKVEIEGEHIDVRNRFSLDSLLPSEMNAIYAYRGSVTFNNYTPLFNNVYNI